MNTTTADHRRILIVDDSPSIHADFRKILGGSQGESSLEQCEAELFGEPGPAGPAALPFEVDSAFQGEEGLQRIEAALEEGRPYAMAFVDVRMPPGCDGVEMVARAWQVCPDLQVVLCTAYSDYSLDEIQRDLGESERLVILKKPFDNIEVLQLAHALTEKWRLLQQARLKTEELERRVAERTRELHTANQQLRVEMAERARAEAALREAHKMEAVGQLAGGIAHEFNNLLTIIRGYTCGLITDGAISSDDQQALRQVDDAAARAANLTRQLLAFSRKLILQPEALNLGEVVGQIGRALRHVLRAGVTLQILAPDHALCVRGDRAMLEQVMLDLTVNALDAMPQGGQVTIHAAVVEAAALAPQQNPKGVTGRYACLSVTDTGCGIPAENVPHLFEPFFTTKEIGKGPGLGLATVYGIVAQHSGWITVDSNPGQGTTFRIYLPAIECAARKMEAAPATVLGGPETLLHVESNPTLRKLARIALIRHGYHILDAGSVAEARQAWAEHAGKIDLLLMDMDLPDGTSGRDLVGELQSAKPALKVIFCGDHSGELLERAKGGRAAPDFLPKPYTPQQLAAAIRQSLDKK